eukprot:TRINITY_DN8681_c0_g1_i1.p1 TRINITY_DN8681_c0_g1~~TRINITY_DN8681_c0_g1_i1.p1  ORF type:complete len:138 (+),score=28.93 TRINITY_DN8681_c0_g1_i1:306-719(+)
MALMSDTKQLGIGLTVMGLVLSFLGVVLLFDGVLLTMGNIVFLVGLLLTMGPHAAKNFFRKRVRGSSFFFVGVLMVLYGWVLTGLLVEGFGALNLFGNFVPMAYRVLKSLPGVGNFLALPIIQRLAFRLGLESGLPT